MTDLSPIIQAVEHGAQLCRKIQADGVQSHAKGDASPVTTADYGTQAIICRALSLHFPDDAVVAEEGSKAYLELVSPDIRATLPTLLADILGESVSEADVLRWLDYGQDRPRNGRTWVIDPIDGTVGFVSGRYYSICVSYMEAYQPTGAVIGLPRSPIDENGTILHTDGDGLFARPMGSTDDRRVQASGRQDVASLRILDSIKLPADEQATATHVRDVAGLSAATVELYDSQLKYAMIAAGYGDVFVRMPRDISLDPHYIWDHLTGAALIKAGGGRITSIDGQPLDFSQGDSLPHTGFIASNGDASLHDTLLKATKTVFGKDWGF